jgi:hypothetical protein
LTPQFRHGGLITPSFPFGSVSTNWENRVDMLWMAGSICLSLLLWTGDRHQEEVSQVIPEGTYFVEVVT